MDQGFNLIQGGFSSPSWSMMVHRSPSLSIMNGPEDFFLLNLAFLEQIKYNYCPNLKFIKKDNITINNDEVMYTKSLTTQKMVTLSLGFSFEKVKPESPAFKND